MERVLVVPESELRRLTRAQSYAWCLGVLAGFGAALGVGAIWLRGVGLL